LTKSRLLAKLL